MERVLGLTWDHPRGTDALRFLASREREHGRLDLRWDAQPLEGFESAPLEQLARDYDVIVLDHPHLGDALAAGAIWPLEELFERVQLQRWSEQSVGPSQRSYVMAGRTWALPLDAATQVAVRRADRLPTAPQTWDDVLDVAVEVPTALCVAGPHALLTFSALCVSWGEPPAASGVRYVSPEIGERALTIMGRIARTAPDATAALNPIQLLERMSHAGDVVYCPLVYGYVNYAQPGRPHLLEFGDAPCVAADGIRGSVVGGTGIALSRRSRPGPALLRHLAELMSPRLQGGEIPSHSGQPGCVDAWEDEALGRRCNDFYRATRRTMNGAWIRPRNQGYVRFQAEASQVVRDAVLGRRNISGAISELNAAHAWCRQAAYDREEHRA